MCTQAALSRQTLHCSTNCIFRLESYLADMIVIKLMPQAVGGPDKGIVMARVHRVAGVHQHPIQAVGLRRPPPVGHEGSQVQLGVKINLQQGTYDIHTCTYN